MGCLNLVVLWTLATLACNTSCNTSYLIFVNANENGLWCSVPPQPPPGFSMAAVVPLASPPLLLLVYRSTGTHMQPLCDIKSDMCHRIAAYVTYIGEVRHMSQKCDMCHTIGDV